MKNKISSLSWKEKTSDSSMSWSLWFWRGVPQIQQWRLCLRNKAKFGLQMEFSFTVVLCFQKPWWYEQVICLRLYFWLVELVRSARFSCSVRSKRKQQIRMWIYMKSKMKEEETQKNTYLLIFVVFLNDIDLRSR